MRIFWIAIAVFALVTAFLVLDIRYVAKTAESLTDALARCPAEVDAKPNDLRAFQIEYDTFYRLFTDREKLLHMLCGHTETNRVRDAFFDMAARYIAGDNGGYRSARSKLSTALRDLCEAEEVSFDNFS